MVGWTYVVDASECRDNGERHGDDDDSDESVRVGAEHHQITPITTVDSIPVELSFRQHSSTGKHTNASSSFAVNIHCNFRIIYFVCVLLMFPSVLPLALSLSVCVFSFCLSIHSLPLFV